VINFAAIRTALGAMDASSAHTASGESRPKIEEIFAPEQHAGALDPNTIIVLGARGAGKSFWAGVLGNDDTRAAAAEAYPNLGLEEIAVRCGFTGISGDGSVSRATVDAQVEKGTERIRGALLWRCVMLRALWSASGEEGSPTIGSMMTKYADPEEWEAACADADQKAQSGGKKVLILFDALDALSEDWTRLRDLIDALLEVSWSIRGYRSIRAKLFLRPDQMRDLGLRFVELPKMMAGATNLRWTGVNLYGMFYARLGSLKDESALTAYKSLLESEGIGAPSGSLRRMRRWPLAIDRRAQAQVFVAFAGYYMGRSNKKGRTYDWPVNHLADGHGEVTPRSFMTLLIFAARMPATAAAQVITAEGIRHGLREASKVRVNQLDLEFPWIKRVLAPLARIQVPCTTSTLELRWRETQTIDAVMNRAKDGEFLPPFNPSDEGNNYELLISRLVRIGVLTVRNDGRFDMPDLFRVAARLLKKGGVAPE
jgi:hypothetical protein